MKKIILAFYIPSFLFFQICWAKESVSVEASAIANGKRIEKLIAQTTGKSKSDTDDTIGDKNTTSKDSVAKIKVNITGIENAKQKENAQAFLDLYAENDKPVKAPVYINYLAEKGVEQIQQSLQPFGYYLSEVELTQKQTDKLWEFNYHVKLGKPLILKKKSVTLGGTGKNHPEFVKELNQFPLNVGDKVNQEEYTNFKASLAATAVNYGFFDGDFTRKAIIIGDDYDTADIQLNYDTGSRYLFDHVYIKQDFLDQDVFERYQSFGKGTPYNTQNIADLQRDLYNSGYVKTIDVEAKPNKASKTVPVELTITPKKNKQHKFGIGYNTDTGVNGKYDFDWRWVNRRGHKFNSELFASQKLQKAGLKYTIPGKKPATDNYVLFANMKRDRSGDIEDTLWNMGVAYRDKKGNFAREFGIKWQQEHFTVGNDSGNIGLLTPYARFTYLRTDNPLDTHDGLLLGLTLTGAHTSVLSDTSFFQAIADAKYIKRFGEKHKMLIGGSIGRTWTKDFHELPASYRFFTGGDRTIRGYRFNDIGDTDSSGKNIGGNKMFYTSAEYEYFFRPKMAGAVFVDAGDAYSSGVANIKVGAGFGFHYYSPIGPIKINLAHGFDKPGDKVRLHLSIGPELP